MDTDLTPAEPSVEDAEELAAALIQAIREKRPMPDASVVALTPLQKAAVAKWLEANDAAKHSHHRVSIKVAHERLKLAPFNLRMSRETFLSAVCKEFERVSWAKKQ